MITNNSNRILEKAVNSGWMFNIMLNNRKEWIVSFGRPEWVTDDLSQSKLLPTAVEKTPELAILNAATMAGIMV